MALVIAIAVVVWSGVALVTLALCRAAAAGDRAIGGITLMSEAPEPPPAISTALPASP